MSLIRMIKLGARVAEWAAPRVQEWQRAKSFNEDEGWRNLEAGNPGEAEKHFLLVFEESRPLPSKRLQLTLGIAEAQRRQGRLAEASETAHKALAMATEAKNHESRQEALQVLMDLHVDQGHAAEALQFAQEIIQKENGRPRPDEERLVKHHRKLGAVLLQNGFHEKSVEAYQLSVKLAELTFGLDHVEMADSLTGLGSVLRQTGQFKRAQDCLRTALEIHRAVRGPESREVTEDLNQLAASLEEEGDIQGAVGEYERALSLSERQIGGNPEDTVMVKVHLAALYLQTNRVSAARELLLYANRVLEKRADDRYVLALKVLAFAEEYSNHPEEAQRLRQKAVAVVDKREGRAAPGALDEPKADAAPMVLLPSVPKPSAATSAPQAPVSIIVVTPGVQQGAEAGLEQRVSQTTYIQQPPSQYAQPMQPAAFAETPQSQPNNDFANFYQRPAESVAAPVVASISNPLSAPSGAPIPASLSVPSPTLIEQPEKLASPERTPPEFTHRTRNEEPAAPLSIWKADAPAPVPLAPVVPPSQSIQVPAGMQVVLMTGDQLAGAQETSRPSQTTQQSSEFADFYKTPGTPSTPLRLSLKRTTEPPAGAATATELTSSVLAGEPPKPTVPARVSPLVKVAEEPVVAAAPQATIDHVAHEADQADTNDPAPNSVPAAGAESIVTESAPPEKIVLEKAKPSLEQVDPGGYQETWQQIGPGQQPAQPPTPVLEPAAVSNEVVPAPAPLPPVLSLTGPQAAEPPLFALRDSNQPQSVFAGSTPVEGPPEPAIDNPVPVLQPMLPLGELAQGPPNVDTNPGTVSLSIAANFVAGQVRLPKGDSSFLPKELVSALEASSSHAELQPSVSLNAGPAVESSATKNINTANIETTVSDSPAVFSAASLVLPVPAELSPLEPFAHTNFPLQPATAWRVDLGKPSAPAVNKATITASPAPFTLAGPVRLPEKTDAQPLVLELQLGSTLASTLSTIGAPHVAAPRGAGLETEPSFSAPETGVPYRTISYPSGERPLGGALAKGELQPIELHDAPAGQTADHAPANNDPKPLSFRHRDTRVRYPRPFEQKLSEDDYHGDHHNNAAAPSKNHAPIAIPDEKMLGANGLLHLAILSPAVNGNISDTENDEADSTRTLYTKSVSVNQSSANPVDAQSLASSMVSTEEPEAEELPQLTLGGHSSADDLPDPFGF